METTFRHTDKGIFVQQNDKQLLKCLVAQRQEYGNAKKAEAWKGRLILFLVIVSILASWLNVEWLTAVSSLLAMSLLVISKYIDISVSEHKKHAASIQQYFDITLYSDALRTDNSAWGALLSHSDIADSMSDIDESALCRVVNWYSDYSNLPVEQQVFNCQRENIRWDQKLRREYSFFQIVLFATTLSIVLIIALAVNPTFIRIVSVVTWFVPILEYAVSNLMKLSVDIRRLVDLGKKCDELESIIANGEITKITSDLILLQHMILENREKAYMVPDWFYECRQPKYQKREEKIAEDFRKIDSNN